VRPRASPECAQRSPASPRPPMPPKRSRGVDCPFGNQRAAPARSGHILETSAVARCRATHSTRVEPLESARIDALLRSSHRQRHGPGEAGRGALPARLPEGAVIASMETIFAAWAAHTFLEQRLPALGWACAPLMLAASLLGTARARFLKRSPTCKAFRDQCRGGTGWRNSAREPRHRIRTAVNRRHVAASTDLAPERLCSVQLPERQTPARFGAGPRFAPASERNACRHAEPSSCAP
jgi:hypothetical protein